MQSHDALGDQGHAAGGVDPMLEVPVLGADADGQEAGLGRAEGQAAAGRPGEVLDGAETLEGVQDSTLLWLSRRFDLI